MFVASPPSIRTRSWGGASEGNTLRVWVVLATEKLSRIYFADASDGRFLVREVPLRSGLDELGRERVAQVLATSVRAFVEHRLRSSVKELAESFEVPASESASDRLLATDEGAASGPARPPPHRDEGRRTGVPAIDESGSRSGVQAQGGVFYGSVWRGSDGLGHGPGLRLALGTKGFDWHWAVTVKAQYELPVRARSENVEVRVQTTALRLGVSAEVPMNGILAWGAVAGGGLDDVDYDGSALPRQSLAVGRSGSDLRPVAFVAGRAELTRGSLQAAMELGATMPLVRAHYDMLLEGERRIEIKSWRVQPGLSLEVSWR